MQHVWDDLIHRARLYADDNHDEAKGWIDPADWMTLFQVEYSLLRRKWMREGLLVPAPTDTAFTGPTTSISAPLVIIGVAQDLGNGQLRVLTPLQSAYGRNTFYSETVKGPAYGWRVEQETGGDPGDLFADTTVIVEPQGTTDKYIVRWIPQVAYATVTSAAAYFPEGGDERCVLGVLKRAGVKEMTGGRVVQDLIYEAEAEMKFAAMSALGGDGPRVRRVRPTVRHVLYPNAWPSEPSQWRFM